MTDFMGPAVRRHPDAVAADDGKREWSWAALDAEATEWAGRLRAAGTMEGESVALLLPPGLDALAALHGAFRTGALVAPLHPSLTPPERADALEALDPVALVDATGVHHRRAAHPAGARADDAVAVLWTSGTSGRPRGVLITEGGLRANTEGARRRLGLTSADRWYASLSPAHVGGLVLLVRAAILGCRLHIPGPFALDDLVAAIDGGTVTHASLVPAMLRRLLEVRGESPPPPTLRCLLIGGAAAPPELVRRALDAGFPLALSYGMTEATSQAATAPPADVAADPTSVGRPLPGVEARVTADGALQLRGPTISPGLLDGTPLVDAEGWLDTGDRAVWTDDGRLRITGRRSDRIVSGGVTVDAREVEAVLRTHPAVDDACVVGLPDERWGEQVAALLVGTPEREPFDRWIRERLSPAKRPRRLRSVAALPLNRNGKVDRSAVRALLLGSV